jgi:hypothetical protein
MVRFSKENARWIQRSNSWSGVTHVRALTEVQELEIESSSKNTRHTNSFPAPVYSATKKPHTYTHMSNNMTEKIDQTKSDPSARSGRSRTFNHFSMHCVCSVWRLDVFLFSLTSTSQQRRREDEKESLKKTGITSSSRCEPHTE